MKPHSVGLTPELFPPPHAPSPTCGEDREHLGVSSGFAHSPTLWDPSFQPPPPDWASKQAFFPVHNWCNRRHSHAHMPGTVPSTFHVVSTIAVSMFALEELRHRGLGPGLWLQHYN